MKRATLPHRFLVIALSTATALLMSVPKGWAAPAGEARVRAVIQAFSAGEAPKFERVAQENYSSAALGRRTPEQRAQALKRVFDETGGLEITQIQTAGDTVVATTKGARGGSAVFTFLMGASPDRRIESVSVQFQGTTPVPRADDPYAPYAFLIGEWDTSGGIRQSLRWGPQKSYIWYAVFTRPSGSDHENLHQEGLMTFNAKRKDLDFLFVHEPGSFGQEQGKVRADADGSVVRETDAISGDGTVTHFRQTWRQTGPNTAVTSLLRQEADGTWKPNFPGADKLEMTRRPS